MGNRLFDDSSTRSVLFIPLGLFVAMTIAGKPLP